jgi:hypothetical protein
MSTFPCPSCGSQRSALEARCEQCGWSPVPLSSAGDPGAAAAVGQHPARAVDAAPVGSPAWPLRRIVLVCAALALLVAVGGLLLTREGNESVDVALGDATLHLVAPYGYSELKGSPQQRRALESLTPAAHRLLAVFVAAGDLDNLTQGHQITGERFMAVEVQRRNETSDVSIEAFARLRDQLGKQQNTAFTEGQRPAERLLNKAFEQKDFTIDISGTTPLGVFDETPHSISVASLARFQVTRASRASDNVMALSANALLASNRIIVAYVETSYESPADVEWLKSTSKRWVRRLIEANPSD